MQNSIILPVSNVDISDDNILEFEQVINIEQSKDTLKEFIAFSNPDTC